MIQNYFGASLINNPDYALDKEFLITSSNGLYTASTLCGCNTRKYHAVLAAGNPENDDVYVLVSNIDESIKYKDNVHLLSTHKFPGVYHPDGYKYIKAFYGNPIPKWVFQADDVSLEKEILLSANDNGLLIRYTLEQATAPLEITFNPLLSFKINHWVMKANNDVNKKVTQIVGGISLRPYPNYPELFMQLSASSEFVQAPDWYYNFEYDVEKERGYDFHEDLYSPGMFTVKMDKGDQFVLFVGLKAVKPELLKRRFTTLLKKEQPLNTMEDCLHHAAQQFIIKKDNRTEIIAGYYWFSSWGRDTFISLPGLTLAQGDVKTFKSVINGLLPDIKDGVVPNVGTGANAAYNTVDASLWFIWAIQQYAHYVKDDKAIWKNYGKELRSILEHYRKGTLNNIKMDDDYLISAGVDNMALTWMDAVIDGKAVTPRKGKNVEINALWYNAICFCLQLARAVNDKEFLENWSGYPDKIAASFIAKFWNDDLQYLADYIDDEHTDYSIRPNQIFAVSLPYSLLPEHMQKAVVNIVKEELLTPRGVRTLSPQDPQYIGQYTGDQAARDKAYHQGTVWPWLIGPFIEAYLKENNEEGLAFVEKIYHDFEPALFEKCLYTVSEIYSGDAPHQAVGTVAQAWSVAELLRIKNVIAEYKQHVPAALEINNKL